MRDPRADERASFTVLEEPGAGWQSAFLASTVFEGVVVGGAASGKTWALVHDVLRDVGQGDFHAALLWHGLHHGLEAATRAAYARLAARYDYRAGIWTFPSGARVQLLDLAHAAHARELLRGERFQYVGVDHLEDFTELEYARLVALAGSRGQLRARVRAAFTTPELAGWVASRWSVVDDRRALFTSWHAPSE